MAKPGTSTIRPLPPLLALPLELKQQIFADISEFEDGELWLTILRRTHPMLRYLIPRKTIAPVTPYSRNNMSIRLQYYRTLEIRKDRFLFAEVNHPYLFPPDFYPCSSCGEVLSGSHFEPYRPRYVSEGLKNTRHIPLGSVAAHDLGSPDQRLCKSCHKDWNGYVWHHVCGSGGDGF